MSSRKRFVPFVFALVVLLCNSIQPAAAAELVNSAIGYKLTYPDDWRAIVPASGEPVDLINVRELFHGGLIPPGGATINIQVLAPSETNETALNRLLRTQHPARSSVVVSGAPAERLDTTYDMSPSDQYRRIAIAQRRGGKQFLFIGSSPK